MADRFDPIEFINRVGRRLIFEFEDAAQAGTPGLVGAAREHPALQQLQSLLPNSVGVGSGLVIDTEGGRSRQQDDVIYEAAHCPVFVVNDAPEATYYPCEGVIAIGEVKSSMGSKELNDAFEKVASVKKLKRRAVSSPNPLDPADSNVAFRQYCSVETIQGTKAEEFNQARRELDQIYGFILCNKFATKPETFFQKAAELWKSTPPDQAPNMIVSLNDGIIQPLDARNQQTFSAISGDRVAFLSEKERGFANLLTVLSLAIRQGRTVEIVRFQRYLMPARLEGMTIGMVAPIR